MLGPPGGTNWCVDSAASDCIGNCEKDFAVLVDCDIPLKMGDDHAIRVRKAGVVVIKGYRFPALFVPDFVISLMSVGAIDSLGWSAVFANKKVVLTHSPSMNILLGTLTRRLYWLDEKQRPPGEASLSSDNLVVLPSGSTCNLTRAQARAQNILLAPVFDDQARRFYEDQQRNITPAPLDDNQEHLSNDPDMLGILPASEPWLQMLNQRSLFENLLEDSSRESSRCSSPERVPSNYRSPSVEVAPAEPSQQEALDEATKGYLEDHVMIDAPTPGVDESHVARIDSDPALASNVSPGERLGTPGNDGQCGGVQAPQAGNSRVTPMKARLTAADLWPHEELRKNPRPDPDPPPNPGYFAVPSSKKWVTPSENIVPKKKGKKGRNRIQRKMAKISAEVWHGRLGHANPDAVRAFLRERGVDITVPAKFRCEICMTSKTVQRFQRKLPSVRSAIPFERIHSDLCGPFPVESSSGKRYFIIFVDDCTRYTTTVFLRYKSDAHQAWLDYKAWIKTQFPEAVVRFFHSDNGGEFIAMEESFTSDGILWERSPPYAQHKNATAERMIRTICTKARCSMVEASAPMRLWSEAITHAVQTHRLTPQRRSGWRSPHELLYGETDDGIHLRKFGCVAYNWIPHSKRTWKFSPRGAKCAMLGYVHKTDTIWRLLDMTTQQVVSACNVFFDESRSAWDDIEGPTIAEYEALFPKEEADEAEYESDEEDDDERTIKLQSAKIAGQGTNGKRLKFKGTYILDPRRSEKNYLLFRLLYLSCSLFMSYPPLDVSRSKTNVITPNLVDTR